MWDKVKQAARSFMTGRYGTDQLSMVLVWSGLALYVLDMLLGTQILALLGAVAYALAIFRMFSRNTAQRSEENRRYLAMTAKARRSFRQARTRFANRKTYKYFRCPQCRSWIRLPRNTGSVSVTCKSCHTTFDQTA